MEDTELASVGSSRHAGPAQSLWKHITTSSKIKVVLLEAQLCSRPEIGFTWTTSIHPVSGLKNNKNQPLIFHGKLLLFYCQTISLGWNWLHSMPQGWTPRKLYSASSNSDGLRNRWETQSEWRDSVFRNRVGKRESLSVEGCWEDRKLAWSPWLPPCHYNEGSWLRMEWGERKAEARCREPALWEIAWIQHWLRPEYP